MEHARVGLLRDIDGITIDIVIVCTDIQLICRGILINGYSVIHSSWRVIDCGNRNGDRCSISTPLPSEMVYTKASVHNNRCRSIKDICRGEGNRPMDWCGDTDDDKCVPSSSKSFAWTFS